MSDDYTIAESFRLPSKGLIYDHPVNPNFKIRSMTTNEEMRRLSPTDTPNKTMADIIEDCLIEKPGIDVYNMCMGDYQFIIQKLRIVTYGTDYKIIVSCPTCRESFQKVINLDDLKVIEYEGSSIEESKHITLPRSKKIIELQLQTPRLADEIDTKRKDIEKNNPELKGDIELLLTLESLIKKVDGQILTPIQLEAFIKKLPMMDANMILRAAEKLNGKVGIDPRINLVCPRCGHPVVGTFRYSEEFFRPSVD